MKIGVTSENKLKVNAVYHVYSFLDSSYKIQGYTSSSGIGEQPVDEQTLTGARNRIKDLQRRINGLDRIVSIESGIFEENNQWVDRVVIVILNTKSGEEYVAYSKGVVFPKKYVEKARDIGFDKITVGKVMADDGFVKNAKDPHSTISGKSRQEHILETLRELVKNAEGAK